MFLGYLSRLHINCLVLAHFWDFLQAFYFLCLKYLCPVAFPRLSHRIFSLRHHFKGFLTCDGSRTQDLPMVSSNV